MERCVSYAELAIGIVSPAVCGMHGGQCARMHIADGNGADSWKARDRNGRRARSGQPGTELAHLIVAPTHCDVRQLHPAGVTQRTAVRVVPENATERHITAHERRLRRITGNAGAQLPVGVRAPAECLVTGCHSTRIVGSHAQLEKMYRTVAVT